MISIAPHHSPDVEPDLVTVQARSAAGRIGYVNVQAGTLRCHVGDTIVAYARGAALSLEPNSCRPSVDPDEARQT